MITKYELAELTDRLKKARYRLGLSQQELSKALGISIHTLSNIERGATETMRAKVYSKIMGFLENVGG